MFSFVIQTLIKKAINPHLASTQTIQPHTAENRCGKYKAICDSIYRLLTEITYFVCGFEHWQILIIHSVTTEGIS